MTRPRVPSFSLRASLAAVTLAGAAACTSQAQPPAQARPAAPPEVLVTTVAPEHLALSSEWVATLDGYTNAQIRPQVSGYLISRDYQEGAMVKKGDVLFQIDPRPFETVVAVAKARLAEAQAQAVKTDRDLKRDTPLAEQHAIAQSQIDTDVAADLAAKAAVQSAEAEVQAAQLNVEFTKVTSLIDGVAAIATAQIGDLVGPATLLTTVSQVDPIRAYFPLSEQEYLRVADRLNSPSTSARPWLNGTLTLILAGDVVYPSKGAFLAADRQIDVKTGTIRVSAAFPNPARTLRPGQFGRVRAETRTIDDAILVPQRAVTELQGSFSVRVLGPQNTVVTHQVTVGDQVGSRWIIQHGLQAGDQVIVEGPATKDGATVAPKPYTPPPAAAGSR